MQAAPIPGDRTPCPPGLYSASLTDAPAASTQVNCLQVAQEMEAAGAAAVTLHGRTMKARYSKPADWAMIDGVARGLGIPLIGNGDLLTAYDISRRFAESGCSAVMVGRGALVAPWIFKEWKDGASWFPTTEERVEVYYTLVRYMKEHFGDDEKGRKKAFYFLPWHFGNRMRPAWRGGGLTRTPTSRLFQQVAAVPGGTLRRKVPGVPAAADAGGGE